MAKKLTDFSSPAARKRVEAARARMMDSGWRPLAWGDVDGLGNVDGLQVFAKGKALVYFRFDYRNGGWGILAEIDDTIEIDATFAALDRIDTRTNAPGEPTDFHRALGAAMAEQK